MNDNRCEGWEYNQELCRQLAELQKAGEILKRSVFATRALAKAIEIIREWTRKNKREIRIEDFYENNPKTGPVTIEKVASGKASNGKYKIKGIGKGISKKLYQYCTTGMIEDVQRARDKVLEAKLLKQGKIKNLSSRDKAILALTKVAHIGPKKAEELYNDYHKRTGKDLTRQILMRDKKMYKKLTKNCGVCTSDGLELRIRLTRHLRGTLPDLHLRAHALHQLAGVAVCRRAGGERAPQAQ